MEKNNLVVGCLLVAIVLCMVVILLVGGLLAVGLLAPLVPQPVDENALATQVAATIHAGQTAQALAFTPTPSPTAVPSPTATQVPTPTPTPTHTPTPPPTFTPAPIATSRPRRTPTPRKQQLYIHPGQSITDPAGDVSAAHIDVIELTTALDGETLQVTFQLRDLPNLLTFNRVGVPKDALEYGWSVYVDVDGNPQTGDDRGAEYNLSAAYFVFQPNAPQETSIEFSVEANTWQRTSADRWRYLGSATLEEAPWADTLALRGVIPGISTQSRLFFVTHDFFAGYDRMERD